MSALSCPAVPFKNVVYETYTELDTQTVQATGYTGDAGAEIYVDVDLQSAPLWCVTTSLRSTVSVGTTGPTGQVDLTASLRYSRRSRDGLGFDNDVTIGGQEQSVPLLRLQGGTGTVAASAAFSTSGVSEVSRGRYRMYAVQTYDSADPTDFDVTTTAPTISVVAIPVYTPGL